MVVTNNFDAVSKLGLMVSAGSRTSKEQKLATGQKMNKDAAASLTISDGLRQKMKAQEEAEDIVAENMRSAESSITDIAKADEMIRQANSNILRQADDAVKVQSKQDTISVIELLR